MLRTSRAEELSKRDVNTAYRLYNEIISDEHISVDERTRSFVSYMKYIPFEAENYLSRLRDSVVFLKGKCKEDVVNLLVYISKSNIPGIHRILTATFLYNVGYIEVCYDCFASIAYDTSVLITYRIEACRFLFGSNNDVYRQLSQECIISIVEDVTYPSDFRYKIIAGYISKTGISTMFNQAKIPVAYDEDFVQGLQTLFVNDERNEVRYRILSAGYLLTSKIPVSEKDDVSMFLLTISTNEELDTNTRADAADVLLRLGSPSIQIEARNIINRLGNTVSTVSTVYTDAQNVHNSSLNDSAQRFIKKLVMTTPSFRDFTTVHTEVSNYIRSLKIDEAKRLILYKALNRISIDTATFTDLKVTIAELFVRIWDAVCSYEEPSRKELMNRFIEELMDMSDTCSTGHANRLVNALSGKEVELTIGWKDQIIANVVGRMEARIRDADQSIKDSIVCGMLEDSDQEDRKKYITFVQDNLIQIREELYKEFVKGEFITEEQFTEYFDVASKKWLSVSTNI